MGLTAIGDLHGCARTLDLLLSTLDPRPGDHLVFIGDYIDRGPDSKGVIDRLLSLQKQVQCTFLRGNHEALMLDYLKGVDAGNDTAYELWSMNGGIATLGSYLSPTDQVEIPESHVQFLEETRLYYDHDQFFFVHAGLKPYETIAENLSHYGEGVFLWERSHLKASALPWEKPVVCGHTPHASPINREKLLMIDTGCVYHQREGLGRLCAVRLPEREFVFVPYSE